MMNSTTVETDLSVPTLTLKSPELLRHVNRLRKTDNVSSWWYLLREYAFLAPVIGFTIAFTQRLESRGSSGLWAAPVIFVAIVLVGAGQHRLVTLTHEAAHYMLFRNRTLNEFVSEWFCMFPVLGTTHKYRIQHLAHHQYPNDPDKDTDFVQLQASGHKFNFPMTRWQFLWECVWKQLLWFPATIRYALVRALFDATQETGPFRAKTKRHPIVTMVSLLYMVGLVALCVLGVWGDRPLLFVGVPAVLYVAMVSFYWLIPEKWYTTYVLKSDFSPRFQACLRIGYYTLLVPALASLTWWTGKPWWAYFFVLWLVPLGTTFSWFMILRQVVQHGNANRGLLTNTRVFRVGWPIALSVFPLGNDLHLPHHLFPMVPHYNLEELHRLLLTTKDYREQAVVTDGYFWHSQDPPSDPTVMEMMTTCAERSS